MRLHIVLRTCSQSSVHFKERFIPLPKGEILVHCLKSLIVSLAWLRFQVGDEHSIALSVIDDHSTDDIRAKMMEVTRCCWFPVEFFSLQKTGNNESMKATYTRASQKEVDLLYILEDDYLHAPSAFSEMMKDYVLFKDKLAKHIENPEVALMPVDNRFHYIENSIFSSPIVMGHRRHWRVNYYSNMTLMLSYKAFLSTWDTWWAFSDYQLSRPETFEDALLTPLFRTKINLFTPIPTLAFHVAGHNYESPYVDWKSVWSLVDREFNRLSGYTNNLDFGPYRQMSSGSPDNFSGEINV